MLEPPLHDEVSYLHRELDRQRKRVTDMNYKIEEVIKAVNAVQSVIDGMRKDIKEEGFTKEVIIFKAKLIEDGE